VNQLAPAGISGLAGDKPLRRLKIRARDERLEGRASRCGLVLAAEVRLSVPSNRIVVRSMHRHALRHEAGRSRHGRQAAQWIIAHLTDRFQRHVSAALDGPLVVLLEQGGADEIAPAAGSGSTASCNRGCVPRSRIDRSLLCRK
jgi:hypothetical protein